MTSDVVMTIVCFYCGHACHFMKEAARHDAERPESCLAWRQRIGTQSFSGNAEIESILRALTVDGEGNLHQALDDYHRRIERVYR